MARLRPNGRRHDLDSSGVVVALDAEQRQIDRVRGGGPLDRLGVYGEVAAGSALYPEAFGLDRVAVLSPGDEGHFVAGPVKHCAVVSADRPRAHGQHLQGVIFSSRVMRPPLSHSAT